MPEGILQGKLVVSLNDKSAGMNNIYTHKNFVNFLRFKSFSQTRTSGTSGIGLYNNLATS